MIYRRSTQFKKSYKALPTDIQEKAVKAFKLFQENRNHPSLGVKKIKGRENIWEGRVNRFYRFTFEYQADPDTNQIICLFRNIGRHDIVDHAP